MVNVGETGITVTGYMPGFTGSSFSQTMTGSVYNASNTIWPVSGSTIGPPLVVQAGLTGSNVFRVILMGYNSGSAAIIPIQVDASGRIITHSA